MNKNTAEKPAFSFFRRPLSARKLTSDRRSIPLYLSQVDQENFENLKSSIKTKDIEILLKHLLKRSSLSGLDKEDRKIYESFLFEWAEREPEATRVWAEGQEGQAKELALMTLTTFHAKDDPETAWALLKQVGWVDLSHN